MTAPTNGRARRGGSSPASALSYSTGRVAQVCGAAPRTVIAWCDTGELRAWKIGCHRKDGPGKGPPHRRVAHAELARFLRERGMADGLALIGEALPPPLTVLLAGLPDDLAVALFLAAPPGTVLASPLPHLLALGVALAGPFPGGACAVLDASLGRAECVAGGAWLRGRLPPIRLVGLAGEDDPRGWPGFDVTLRRPCAAGDVLAAVKGG